MARAFGAVVISHYIFGGQSQDITDDPDFLPINLQESSADVMIGFAFEESAFSETGSL